MFDTTTLGDVVQTLDQLETLFMGGCLVISYAVGFVAGILR